MRRSNFVMGAAACGIALSLGLSGCGGSSSGGDDASNREACDGVTTSFRSISASMASNPLTGVDEPTRIRNGNRISESVLDVLDDVEGYGERASDAKVKDAVSGVNEYLVMLGVWVLTPSLPMPDSRAIQALTEACKPYTEGSSS